MGGPGQVFGVVLAGGLARRMGGGDKAMIELGGQPLLSWVLSRLTDQVEGVLLNANGDATRFASYGLPVASDVVEGFAGPLAGVLTGMEWVAANRPDVSHIVTVPADTPFVPIDLVSRLTYAMSGESGDGPILAVASSGGRSHPVVGLWPVILRGHLRKALVEEDIRKIDRWTARYPLAVAEFEALDMPGGNVDPFFNVNRPEDLKAAEALLAAPVKQA